MRVNSFKLSCSRQPSADTQQKKELFYCLWLKSAMTPALLGKIHFVPFRYRCSKKKNFHQQTFDFSPQNVLFKVCLSCQTTNPVSKNGNVDFGTVHRDTDVPFEEWAKEAFVTKVDHFDLVILRLAFPLKKTLNSPTRVLWRCICSFSLTGRTYICDIIYSVFRDEWLAESV